MKKRKHGKVNLQDLDLEEDTVLEECVVLAEDEGLEEEGVLALARHQNKLFFVRNINSYNKKQ